MLYIELFGMQKRRSTSGRRCSLAFFHVAIAWRLVLHATRRARPCDSRKLYLKKGCSGIAALDTRRNGRHGHGTGHTCAIFYVNKFVVELHRDGCMPKSFHVLEMCSPTDISVAMRRYVLCSAGRSCLCHGRETRQSSPWNSWLML